MPGSKPFHKLKGWALGAWLIFYVCLAFVRAWGQPSAWRKSICCDSMCLVSPTHGRKEEEDYKFAFGCVVSLRPTWATQTLSQKATIENETEECLETQMDPAWSDTQPGEAEA